MQLANVTHTVSYHVTYSESVLLGSDLNASVFAVGPTPERPSTAAFLGRRGHSGSVRLVEDSGIRAGVVAHGGGSGGEELDERGERGHEDGVDEIGAVYADDESETSKGAHLVLEGLVGGGDDGFQEKAVLCGLLGQHGGEPLLVERIKRAQGCRRTGGIAEGERRETCEAAMGGGQGAVDGSVVEDGAFETKRLDGDGARGGGHGGVVRKGPEGGASPLSQDDWRGCTDVAGVRVAVGVRVQKVQTGVGEERTNAMDESGLQQTALPGQGGTGTLEDYVERGLEVRNEGAQMVDYVGDLSGLVCVVIDVVLKRVVGDDDGGGCEAVGGSGKDG